MRTLLLVALTVPAAFAQSPRLLATADDFARIESLAGRQRWAEGVRTSIIQAARNWPKPYLDKYGLKEWSIPPEGGQWTHWYVCPTHGNGLRFTAPDRHVCPVDNRRWTDKKFDQVVYSWRNTDNANAARDLALAYRFTADAELGRSAGRILLDYAKVYSAWPIHDTNGRDARSGARLSAQTLDESVLLIPLAWAYDLLAGSGVLTAEEELQIERELLRPAVATIRRNDMNKSNWQSWHNTAIAAVGFALGDRELIAEAIDGRSGFRFQMSTSVFDDGFWYEGAWSYHFYALEPLWLLAEMGARNGYDLYSEAPLRRMFEAPLRFSLPDWSLPPFNDSNVVSVTGSRRYFEPAWNRYIDPLFTSVLRSEDRGREALFWGSEELAPPAATARKSEVFLMSGYAALRNPSSDHTIILDFGPHGDGHGHYDKLGFVSFANGGNMAVDPGTQPYAAPTHNTWDKATVAHNTVVVDEKSQVAATGRLIHFAEARSMTAVRTDAGAAYRQASLERTMYLAPEYAVDVVTARSLDGNDHQFDWFYHNYGTLNTSLDVQPFSSFPQAEGYQHLTRTRSATTASDWQVGFDMNGSLEGNFGSAWANLGGIRTDWTWSREQSLSGLFASRITYDFGEAGGYTLYTTPFFSNHPTEPPQRVSMWIYGDGSGNKLTYRVHDAADERFVRTFGDVDWTGWKEIVIEDPARWSHWGGNNDGVLDLPLRAVAIEFAYNRGAATKGTLYVDDIAVDYAGAGRLVVHDFERPLRGLRLWMLGADGTSVVVGDGLGPDLRVPVPFAMARRRGREATFVSLLEPHGERPRITSFRQLEDGSFEVKGPGHRDVFILNNAGELLWKRSPE